MLVAIGTRLKELRKNNNFSQKEVAHKLFISQSAYSLMETSHNGIISEHVIRLSEMYKVTTDFILKGNTKLIEMDVKNGFFPFITSKAHAGFIEKLGADKLSGDFEYYRIPGYNPTKDSILIEVEGNSMQPTVSSGDILICQKQKNFDLVLDGSIAVLVTKDDLVTKRLYKHENENYFWTESDNPDADERTKLKKKDILQLLMVQGKASTVLIPHGEMAFKGKIRGMEETIDSLGREIYNIDKKLNSLLSNIKPTR